MLKTVGILLLFTAAFAFDLTRDLTDLAEDLTHLADKGLDLLKLKEKEKSPSACEQERARLLNETVTEPEGPEGTTEGPEGTTEGPEGTIEGPEGITEGPEGTTESPKETTKGPETGTEARKPLIPNCDANGDYAPLQCSAANDRCVCYSKDGKNINWPSSEIKACDCVRAMDDALKAVKSYVPRCQKDGNYEPKQCDKNGTCWCVDKEGKALTDPKKEEEEVQCDRPI